MTHVLSTLRAASFSAFLGLGAVAMVPNAALAIEPVQRIVSPGGVEALLIESHEVGVISMRLSFKGGAVQEPADKPGVANMTSFMFNEGAGDLTTQDLMRRLTRIGASFFGETGAESVQITFAAPSAQRAEAFGFLKLAIEQPRYDAEPMERARRSALASLEAEKVDPSSIAMRRLAELLYAGTRYAMPVKGTTDSVAKITADDVRAYRARMFARDNLRVAVAGDIDAASLKSLLDDLFGSLPAKADLLPEAVIAPVKPQQQTIAVDIPQTLVVFGNAAPLLDARQGLAASLFNQVLSATFTGRLFTTLREREGLVYSIGTSRGRSSQLETFYGSFGAAPGNAARAMSLTMSEIERLANDGPSEQELNDAKSAFRGGYFLGLDTSANLSAMLMTMLEQSLPDTYLKDFDAQVASITVDEVRAIGKVVARPDQMVSVSAGRVDKAAVDEVIR